MNKRILLIWLLWILSSGAAWAQEPAAMPDAAAGVQEQPSQTGQNAEASTGTATMTDIHDIKPLVSVPVPVSLATVLLWAAVCLLVAAGVLGAWFLWKRHKATPMETIEAQLSPEDAALQRLAALSLDTMDGRAFYYQLSAIFREYLHGRYHIDGLEMTTEELLPHVETMTMERDLKREIKAFLVSSDPVKFAGAPTRRETMEKDHGFVRGFVEKTMAPPPAPETDCEPVHRQSDGKPAPLDASE